MANRSDGDQFHFDPASYLEAIRAEVPSYDELQDTVAEATAGIQAERVLELGVGTAKTSGRVLDLHPEAKLVGIDESAEMLAAASRDVAAADLRVSRLQDPLPEGNFDLVVSALAVHHLDAVGRRTSSLASPLDSALSAKRSARDDTRCARAVAPRSRLGRPSTGSATRAWMINPGLRVWTSRSARLPR